MMLDLYLWMVCIGLTLVVLSVCWELVKTASAEPSIRDRSEYVRIRKAMTPDELPVPSDCPQDEIDIDIKWKRRN